MGDFQKGAVDCETMSKLMQCGWIYTTFHEIRKYFWSFFVDELKSYRTIWGIFFKSNISFLKLKWHREAFQISGGIGAGSTTNQEGDKMKL